MAGSQVQPDYVWRFKLSAEPEETLCSDPLAEAVRRELKALLGCVVLTRGEQPVRVDGFRFLGEAETVHGIYAASSSRPEAEAAAEAGEEDGAR